MALLRQKARPSLYFFRSLHERASGRRRRSQGFRRTTGDSVPEWNLRPGDPKGLQRSNPSGKAAAVLTSLSPAEHKESLVQNDSLESLNERVAANFDLIQRRENASSNSWDLEKGFSPPQDPGLWRHAQGKTDGLGEGRTQARIEEEGQEVEALWLRAILTLGEADKVADDPPTGNPISERNNR